ncbi:hypothetical protein LCGC14_3047220, partial [marine sediment metagenome]
QGGRALAIVGAYPWRPGVPAGWDSGGYFVECSLQNSQGQVVVEEYAGVYVPRGRRKRCGGAIFLQAGNDGHYARQVRGPVRQFAFSPQNGYNRIFP